MVLGPVSTTPTPSELKNLTSDIYLVQFPTELFDPSGISIDSGAIERLSKYRLVIINCSHENWGQGFVTWLDSLLNKTNLNYIILSHDPTDHLIKPYIIFYPWWYYVLLESAVAPTDIENPRKYKLSCLNRIPRPHRILNYLLLKKKNYFDDCLVTAHQPIYPEPVLNKDDRMDLDSAISDEWNQLKPTLSSANKISGYFNVNNDAYNNSYINLVTESSISPNLFVTEKAWKSVASGQLFLIIGNPGIISHLRDQGVDVFDDVIDHKYYDTELVIEQRIHKIHTLIDSLMNQDLHAIYQQTVDRRNNNITNFFNGSLNTQYNKSLQLCINTQN